jgi:hypothetical protein
VAEWLYRLRFLDLGTSLRWVVSFTPRPPYPRGTSSLLVVLNVPQNRYGRYGEEKILEPIGTRKSDHTVVQPVASRNTDCAFYNFQGNSLNTLEVNGLDIWGREERAINNLIFVSNEVLQMASVFTETALRGKRILKNWMFPDVFFISHINRWILHPISSLVLILLS